MTETRGSRDMSPTAAVDCSPHHCFCDTKLARKRIDMFTIVVAAPCVFNMVGRQLRAGVATTARRLATILGKHVVHVIGMCSNEEMSGIEASRVVASMQYMELTREIEPQVDHCRHTMNAHVSSVQRHATVATASSRCNGTAPIPTAGLMIDRTMCKESRFDYLCFDNLGTHGSSSFHVTPGPLRAVPGTFNCRPHSTKFRIHTLKTVINEVL